MQRNKTVFSKPSSQCVLLLNGYLLKVTYLFTNVAVSIGMPHCWRNIAHINNYLIEPNYEEKSQSGACEDMF